MTTKAASLADELVRLFEQRIDSGELPPGARFPTEMAITTTAGVSRTVVREAFARLSARGLLVSRRGSGAYVAEGALYRAFQVEPEEMQEVEDVVKLLEMRMALETEMAGLAAQRRTGDDLALLGTCLDRLSASDDVEQAVDADVAFHAAIARATHNEYYSRFMDFLGLRLVPRRSLYLRDQADSARVAYARAIHRDHEAIYAAIVAQEPARARHAARRHMQKSLERHRRLAATAWPNADAPRPHPQADVLRRDLC
ncbi:MAG: GntR family transcriptional regulator [Sphingomonas bacterium]|uniref:FadR/GntR family transcriptional regulator n=1 Tax=Sphingomonas bacterium TaxID=1895847 RepID=UPI0026363E0F|nr:FCD domain-containing protein [Sphingomonas bacterium]MDB5707746.1 GntR family transcriptional regulator [Sphingomonas bacterium]